MNILICLENSETQLKPIQRAVDERFGSDSMTSCRILLGNDGQKNNSYAEIDEIVGENLDYEIILFARQYSRKSGLKAVIIGLITPENNSREISTLMDEKASFEDMLYEHTLHQILNYEARLPAIK